MRLLAAALLTALIVVASCGRGEGTPLATTGDERDDDPAEEPAPRYTATATVLESPEHGPQLCLGGVADSYPPQCGGPDVHGWNWGDVEQFESAGGTTWGTYTVIGTWDGQALTLTEPPQPPRPSEPGGATSGDEDRFATPCEEPEAGWRPVDDATTSDEAMQAAIAYARAQDTVGGIWLDQSINPARGREPVDEAAMNDASRLVLNASFTDGLEQHEAAMREIWGGALCVSEAPVGAVEADRLRSEVEAEIGDDLLSSNVDEISGRVEVAVPVDDGLQQRFDDRYGPGAVAVGAQLRPLEG